MLQFLLPLLESLGVSAGTAGSAASLGLGSLGAESAVASAGARTAGAAAGSTSSMSGGLQGILQKFMGHVPGFENAEQLGQGVQQAQQIADAIASLKSQLADTTTRQESMSSSAVSVDEFTGAKTDRSQDPEFLKSLADLQHQRAAFEQQIAAKKSQLTGLNMRITQTTSPQNPASALSQGGAMGMLGGAASFLPSLFSGGGGQQKTDPNLAAQLAAAPSQSIGGPIGSILNSLREVVPGAKIPQNLLQAGLQPLTDLAVGGAEGKVIGGATGFLSEGMNKLTDPMALMRGEHITHMAKMPGLLKEWGEELVDSRKHLMQFSGTLAQTFLEAERRQLIRNVQSGERTSGATAGLSDSLQDLADNVQPIKDAVTIVMSRGVESLVRGMNVLIEISKSQYDALKFLPYIGQNIEAIEKVIQRAGKSHGPPGTNLNQFLQQVNSRDLRKPRKIERR